MYKYLFETLFSSSKYISISRISGFYDNSVYFLRNCHVVFPSGSTIFLPTNKCIRVPVSPLSHQNLLFSDDDDDFHARRFEVVSHGSLDLYLHSDI